ncbi:Hypothetical predicted protein [Paramuricea clavata]|uniref:Uncharacterized protein n=1 Tax=Paramuricea clavata TaxID=317549 RepID=A0A7D9ITN5_PARCT|nr:Hypothetical predicted protein [Paramuricea clavata]
MGQAYIVAALKSDKGTTKLDDKVTVNAFSDNITCGSKENKKKYYDNVFGQFIDRIVLQKCDESHDDDDYVMNYGLCFIFLAILILQMKGTAAEVDGQQESGQSKPAVCCIQVIGKLQQVCY